MRSTRPLPTCTLPLVMALLAAIIGGMEVSGIECRGCAIAEREISLAHSIWKDCRRLSLSLSLLVRLSRVESQSIAQKQADVSLPSVNP